MSSLPIYSFRSEILAAVREHPAVVIVAETGAGKSTQVPQYLLEEGYDIVVTQPRRLAARTVASRVAHERGEKLGQVVGYRTAFDRLDSDATRCLFCTDGLAMVRELMGVGNHNVLILDEVHEWNLNIEVLVAWAKLQIEQGAQFKVIVMSATLDAGRLSLFLGNAPIISVPGRLHPVEVCQRGASQIEDVATLLRRGRNVLWFQPGKTEIAKAIEGLHALEINAELLPLHGELDSAEQDKCFRHYGRPKCICATNVAQTSITIDDIDAVVDTGVERRIELVDGVEGLYLKAISHADAAQRKGRAGRTKPGIYIDWCPTSDRLDFPKAEILRSRLDQTVLRLAEAGFDMEELTFFHQPDLDDIHEAKRALKALGCMDSSGAVTRVGRRVAKLPISVQFGRMVIEAERLGVVDDVITIAAILEQGEITMRKIKEGDLQFDALPLWRAKFCPDEKHSDVLAQLAVYKTANDMTKDEMRQSGISLKAYYQAKEKRRHLADGLRGRVEGFDESSGKKEDILKAVCAGMVDHLYRNVNGRYYNGDLQERELAKESVVQFASTASSKWIVCLPFDLQLKAKRGGYFTLRLVRMVTCVDPMWLAEVAPQSLEKKNGLRPMFDREKDSVISVTEYYFNGLKVKEEPVLDPSHPDAMRLTIEHIYGSFITPGLPRFEMNGTSVVPSVHECVVGLHPETREPLKIYGTYRSHNAYGTGWSTWLRTKSEAEYVRSRFEREVALYREEISRQAESVRKAEEARRNEILVEERVREKAEAAKRAAEANALALKTEQEKRNRARLVTPGMLQALRERFCR